ncbi:hypothetical protein FQZ97_1120360 [compost metagenome]
MRTPSTVTITVTAASTTVVVKLSCESGGVLIALLSSIICASCSVIFSSSFFDFSSCSNNLVSSCLALFSLLEILSLNISWIK